MKCSFVHISVSGSHENLHCSFIYTFCIIQEIPLKKDTFCLCRFVHLLVYIILILIDLHILGTLCGIKVTLIDNVLP
ncbi:hypothetical protein VNO78_25849 [Psophocarpus tetragonolobus]|uniref:Uncharacterized protein n=1 Tax=Psophocarpus tetragonolobus TaxID=3891 RepID=A0AAN9XFT3_PSOTE